MKPRVLILIDWFYPGFRSGGPATSCLNLTTKLREHIDFFVVTRDSDYCNNEVYEGIEHGKWNETPFGAQVRYLSPEEVSRGSATLIAIEGNFDVVYLNGLYSRWFTLHPLKALSSSKARVLLSPRGMLSKGSLSVKPLKKLAFLFLAKATGLFRNAGFHATNAEEASQIKKWLGKREIHVIANLPGGSKVLPPADKKSGELRLLTVARYAPEKNIHFALEALGKMKEKVYAVFYGPVYDEDYFQLCKRVADQLPSNIKVELEQEIAPDRLAEALSATHFLYHPSTGENYGHVIAESLMAGRPVIISDRTPWRGLAEQNAGFDVPLDQQEFASILSRCALLGQDDYLCLASGAAAYWKRLSNEIPLIEKYLKIFGKE